MERSTRPVQLLWVISSKNLAYFASRGIVGSESGSKVASTSIFSIEQHLLSSPTSSRSRVVPTNAIQGRRHLSFSLHRPWRVEDIVVTASAAAPKTKIDDDNIIININQHHHDASNSDKNGNMSTNNNKCNNNDSNNNVSNNEAKGKNESEKKTTKPPPILHLQWVERDWCIDMNEPWHSSKPPLVVLRGPTLWKRLLDRWRGYLAARAVCLYSGGPDMSWGISKRAGQAFEMGMVPPIAEGNLSAVSKFSTAAVRLAFFKKWQDEPVHHGLQVRVKSAKLAHATVATHTKIDDTGERLATAEGEGALVSTWINAYGFPIVVELPQSLIDTPDSAVTYMISMFQRGKMIVLGRCVELDILVETEELSPLWVENNKKKKSEEGCSNSSSNSNATVATKGGEWQNVTRIIHLQWVVPGFQNEAGLQSYLEQGCEGDAECKRWRLSGITRVVHEK